MAFGVRKSGRRQKQKISQQAISVVIPFRNERQNLPGLLQSLNAVKLINGDEILLIDDGSDDGGIEEGIFIRPEIKVMRLLAEIEGSKKAAITFGINESKNAWILTSDADCSFGPEWVNEMRKRATSTARMIIGPVLTKPAGNLFLRIIQRYESVCLLAISAGTCGWRVPILCSGANLLFSKISWKMVNGYASHSTVTSGDDVLFMNDLWKYDRSGIEIISTPGSLVFTQGVNSWKSWLEQRERWISKTAHVDHFIKRLISFGVICWLYIPVLAIIISMFFGMMVFWLFLIVEAIMVFGILRGFGEKFRLDHWVIFRFMYPLFMLHLWVFRNKADLQWKGRPVNGNR